MFLTWLVLCTVCVLVLIQSYTHRIFEATCSVLCTSCVHVHAQSCAHCVLISGPVLGTLCVSISGQSLYTLCVLQLASLVHSMCSCTSPVLCTGVFGYLPSLGYMVCSWTWLVLSTCCVLVPCQCYATSVCSCT